MSGERPVSSYGNFATPRGCPTSDNALGTRELLPREHIVDAAYKELYYRDNLEGEFTYRSM
jgi:hypothetical protein